jgi:hypothetical protein
VFQVSSEKQNIHHRRHGGHREEKEKYQKDIWKTNTHTLDAAHVWLAKEKPGAKS